MAVVIGLCGATASGKSTLAEALRERLRDRDPMILGQDRYFRTFPDAADRTSNHPRAVLWESLVDHVRTLRSGGAIRLPVPGTRGQERGDPASTQGPAGVVIVEGHLLYNRSDLSSLLDLRVFVDAHVHERVVRRLLRDTRRAGSTLEAAAAWYRRDVAPNVGRYSESLRNSADLIVPFDRPNEAAVEAVARWVETRLGGPG